MAIGEIERCAGSQFDPELAELFVAIIDDHRKSLREAGQASLVPP